MRWPSTANRSIFAENKNMKSKILISLLASLLLLSCKKSGETMDHLDNASWFSYDGQVVKEGAECTASKRGDYLIFTLRKPGMEANVPELVFQIHNYSGPKTYDFAQGNIQVYGAKNGDEFFWTNILEDRWTVGSITVKTDKGILVAEANGFLDHAEVTGGNVKHTQTDFKAFIRQSTGDEE